MKEESLQLVTYDGQQIPSGYLFGNISARLAITYLKSINASEDAIDKVKEVEVNKILYGIGVAKSADDALGQTHVAMHNGTVYGGGNPMIPAAATQIKKHLAGEELAEGWTVQSKEEYQAAYMAQNQQPMPAPQVLGPQEGGEPTHLGKPKKPSRKKVGPELTTDITTVGKNNLEIDLEGNKPNIALNLLTLLSRYSPTQSKILEEFLLSGGKNGNKFVLDLSDIPQEIRDEVMPWVLDPSRNAMSIHEKLNRISRVSSDYDPGISPEVRKRLGESLSGDMLALFESVNFKDMVSSGAIKIEQLESVFPVLAEAMKLNMAGNNGELSDDFTLSSDKFLVRWDVPTKYLEQTLGAISESIKLSAITLSEFKNKFKNKGNADIDATGALVLPVFNLILNKDNKFIVDEMAKYTVGLDVNDAESVNKLHKAIDKVRDYLKSNAGKDGFPTEEELSNLLGPPKHAAGVIDRDDFPLKDKESAYFVDMMIAFAKEAQVKGENSEYGARTGKGVMRNIPRIAKVAAFPTSFEEKNPDKSLELKRDRAVKLFKTAASLSVAAFNDGIKESTFRKGLQLFNEAHSILESWSGGFESIDYVGMLRISPLLHDGKNIIFIDENCEVKTCPLNASDKDKEAFATEVYASLNKLVQSNTITSERAAYAMVAITEPQLAHKFRHKPESTKHLVSGAAQRVYAATADATSSFVRNMIDPILGQRIQNGVGGASLVGKADYLTFRAKNAHNKIHESAIEIAVRGKGSITLNGTTHSFDNPAEFKDFLKDYVASEMGIDPSEVKPAAKKMQTKGEVAYQIVKAYTTLGKFDTTMKLLDNDEFVEAMIDGRSPDEMQALISAIIPGISEIMLKDIKLPDMSQFTSTLTTTFDANHVDRDAKIASVKGFMKEAIKAGAEKELRGRVEGSDPLSASQLSQSFEAVSAVGNFIAQLAQYPKHTVTGAISGDGRGIGAIIDTGMFVELQDPKTGKREQIHMGMRKSIESNSHIDAFNSRVSKGMNAEGKHVNGISLGFLEFKFLSGSNANGKIAHLLATQGPMRDLVDNIRDYDEISLDPVLNIANMIDSPEKSHVAELDWDCSVGAGTEMSNDGNRAHGRKRKYGAES